jgi:uroporphyrin-3 C-methyltransferase
MPGAQAIEARTLARQAQEQAHRSQRPPGGAGDARQRSGPAAQPARRADAKPLALARRKPGGGHRIQCLRLAQQQAQLTGSLEPLVAALKSAQQRIERAAQPRLAPVQRAMARDLERMASASVTDTAGLLARLDELVRQVDDLPLQNAVAQAAATRRLAASVRPALCSCSRRGIRAARLVGPLQRSWEVVRDECAAWCA